MGNKSSSAKLAPEALADLTSSTNFTEADIRRWYKDFIRDFPSGEVTIDEFKTIYAQQFPNGDPSRFAEHVFRTFDKDSDHKLDFREFLVALSINSASDPKGRLTWAFKIYDMDDNGYITKDECVEIIKSLSKLVGTRLKLSSLTVTPEERMKRIFSVMDIDKDGRISLKEFINGAHADPDMVAMLESSA